MANFIILVSCIIFIILIFKISSLLEKRIEKIEKVEGTEIVQGWRTDMNFIISLILVIALAIRALFAGFALISSLIL